MASPSLGSSLTASLIFFFLLHSSQAQLSSSFYDRTCPNVGPIVRHQVKQALTSDTRILSSFLQLFFDDCFGCDGSILLDNSNTIESKKDTPPNKNSVRGFDVVDDIKAAVEKSCPRIVSCVDTLALVGGPLWRTLMGRRDGTTTNFSATAKLPGSFSDLTMLQENSKNVDLNDSDLAALSAYTFGRAQCGYFSNRLYDFVGSGDADPALNATYHTTLCQCCPQGGNTSVLNDLDPTTLNTFDKKYFANLQTQEGLLHSDQELLSAAGAEEFTALIVVHFVANQTAFFESFVVFMIRMGNISLVTRSGVMGRSGATAERSTTLHLSGLRSKWLPTPPLDMKIERALCMENGAISLLV